MPFYSLTAYSVGFLLVLALSYAAATGAFALYFRLPEALQDAWWMGWGLNAFAPIVGGLVAGAMLVALLVKKGWFQATIVGHFSRTVLWYGFSVWVIYIVMSNTSNSDFGLWSQIITWPLFGTCAALAVDILSSVAIARRAYWRKREARHSEGTAYGA